ncbi:hypothetical protein DJ568_05820 [Mucilaginibacter hurinus]|uniref:Peptidase M56 domain-containing protein n=1 Tax=Mucilaginibacter hurinus TaxID=2201324 RepID=A0A367GPM0_9SPHI|nr:M56 family metallopeptidase [Mucilaginibacter hurinus]RCH55409.1 hypothetical protein DJ568_05820 [Mucilaginibacter hurinus]
METLTNNISQILGITILHSLWQGLLIYLLLTIILSGVPRLSSARRHNISLAAVAAMAVWFVVTLIAEGGKLTWLAGAARPVTPLTAQDIIPPLTYLPAAENVYYYVIKEYLPYISVIYLTGFILNFLKLCFGWRNISLVKQSLTPALHFESTVKQMCLQLNIKKNVLVSYSRMVDVPGVIGFFKPIVLLPLSITTNLSVAEVEAILLHELSHIKRNDYLLNLIQQVISVLLFFNPFALLINRIINSERENCCDDAVVNITGQPLIYARALLTLEQTKQRSLQLALAATGKKYHLLNRVERIMTSKNLNFNVRHLLAAILLFTFSAGSIAWLNPEIKGDRIKLKVPHQILNAYFYNDTLPTRKPGKKQVTKISNTKVVSNSQVNNVEDAEFERLSKEVENHGKAVEKYYESAAYQNINKAIENNLNEQILTDESPKVKDLLKRQELAAAAFEKYFENNSELQKLHEQMDKAGNELDQHYNSPEMKKLETELNQASERLNSLKTNSTAYKKELEKIRTASAQLGRLHATQQLQAQKQNLQLISQKIKQIHESEDFKKKQAELSKISDSISKTINNAVNVKTREYTKNLNKRLQALNNSPEITRAKKQLQEASAKLSAYVNSSDFKKRVQAGTEMHDVEEPVVVEEITLPGSPAPAVPQVPDATPPAEPAN